MRDGLTLYCIRHGETDWNKENRYQGQRDIPLNDTGHGQATQNGRKLAALNLDFKNIDFIASPLSRARQTMERIRSELDLTPRDYSVDDRLKEVHYGVWEGQLLRDLIKNDAKGLAARKADPYNWRPEGGESYSELFNRAVEWLNSIERDAVVVTHGGVTRVLRCHALDLDPQTLLELEVPQDLVLVLKKNQIEWI